MRTLLLLLFAYSSTFGQEILYEEDYQTDNFGVGNSNTTQGNRWQRFDASGDGNDYVFCGSNYNGPTESWFVETGFNLAKGESADISFDYRGRFPRNGGMNLRVKITDGFGVNDHRGFPEVLDSRVGSVNNWERASYTFTAERTDQYYLYIEAIAPRDDRGSVDIDNILVTKSGILGVDDLKGENSISFYPNPSKNIIYFQNLKNNVHTITLYDTTGKVVMKNQEIQQDQLNISSLDNGLYFIEISDDSNNTTTDYLLKK